MLRMTLELIIGLAVVVPLTCAVFIAITPFAIFIIPLVLLGYLDWRMGKI